MKYIVVEFQTKADGKIGILTFSYDSRLEAESKYHTILAAAAISTLPVHTCCLFQNDGITLARQCYVHEQATEEEPTE